jgi:hypothetical protein
MKKLLLVTAFAVGVSLVIALRRASDTECEDSRVQDIDVAAEHLSR